MTDLSLPIAAASPTVVARMRLVLQRQQAAFRADGAPSAALRIDRIDRTIALLLANQRRICDAMAEDYSWRSHDHTRLSDLLLPLGALKHARRHVRRWMRPQRRRPELGLGWLGAKAIVRYQPLGSIGIMVPWNFPVAIGLSPLAEALAAGNRAMLKLSEFTPATARLLIELLAARFDESEVAAFVGDAEVGAAFAALPFDHLVFTGSPRVARRVMRAAADNLTPVTLELGGKSPTIVGRGADLAQAAARIWAGKAINGGQACIAPDYVLVHEDDREALIGHMTAAVARMFPTLRDNPDYTAQVTPAQHARMMSYVEDARARGVRVVEINPARETFAAPVRKVPPTLFVDPPDDAAVMRDEIFGPLLPVLTYRRIDDAVAYVNDRPRPLALYYFGDDAREAEQVLASTTSGGVCVNDVMQHVFQGALPFGGCGNSGFGRYHGGEGFKAFSVARGVYVAPRVDVLRVLRPPYGAVFRRVLGLLLRA
ncbi:MAG: coniferyl aldehyde dehydrogenase [Burkholderiales bacterium]|nr:coniferyl aldehyde dehydrogenase [Burkholderiales bacterium]